jgi:hypothetical protein
MDITKLTQNLIAGLQQKNTEQLVSLSRLLNLAIGKTVLASITEITPVTAQEREALLTQTLEALAQSNKLARNMAQLTPQLKTDILRLMEQQLLIKSPELKWMSLLINNQPLLTYSDKPFATGQTLYVQLLNPQKLMFVDLPGNNTQHLTPTTSLTGTSLTGTQNTNPSYSIKTPASLFNGNLNDAIKNGVQLSTLSIENKTSVKQIIADSLRQLLPHQDIPAMLYSALTHWQNIPKINQQQLVSPSLEQALKSVAEKIRSPQQLSQPKALAQIIKNSGVFFENTLKNQLAATTQLPPNISTTIKSTVTQDLKGSLLHLFNNVNQELTGDKKPLSTEQTVKLLQQLNSYAENTRQTTQAAQTTAIPADIAKNSLPNSINLPIDLNVLMQQLMNKPVKELSNKELRTQLLVLLQQHSLHSLAKIQLQQLASLNHNLNNSLNNSDGTQATASWQIDIPVKHHNEVQQLHLHIEREWVDDKNSTHEKKSTVKIKQWSVTLRFDLPTLGEFCAQLAIIDTSISATLWATRETTLVQVRQHLEHLRKQLEQEGIQVKQLQCIKGMPPLKPIALGYALIDIST